MARFDRVDCSRLELLNRKNCFLVKGTLTSDDVEKLNEINKKIVLIFENTKGQNSDVIGSLDDSHIRVSVVGGLNYLSKQKYNDSKIIRRTMHTPDDMRNIIKVFESIEKRIMFSWTESQKCLFVYKCFCEMLDSFDPYDKLIQNGVDYLDSLTGLLYGKIKSEGVSLAFKEMMDRIGIECHYQSIKDLHSFNVVKIDGKYHGLDLFWDINNKRHNNKCEFKYYGYEDGNGFYNNKYHNIIEDDEEIRYPVVPISKEDIKSDLVVVNVSKKEISTKMTKYTNSEGETFTYTYLGESCGFSIFVVRQADSINYFYISKNERFNDRLSGENLSMACFRNHNLSFKELPKDIKKFSRYIRKDGSNFILYPTGKTMFADIKEYAMLEPYMIDGNEVLKKSIILSKNDLIGNKSKDFRKLVSNYQLSKERLDDRLKSYGGYIGFLSNDSINYIGNHTS